MSKQETSQKQEQKSEPKEETKTEAVVEEKVEYHSDVASGGRGYSDGKEGASA